MNIVLKKIREYNKCSRDEVVCWMCGKS